MTLMPGTKLGAYEIIESIGVGLTRQMTELSACGYCRYYTDMCKMAI
jgi:hypothetical protein